MVFDGKVGFTHDQIQQVVSVRSAINPSAEQYTADNNNNNNVTFNGNNNIKNDNDDDDIIMMMVTRRRRIL